MAERLDQLRVAVLLGDQPADQPHIRRTVSGKALLHRAPQLGAGVAEIGRLEHRQLTGDHMRHQARLVAEAAIDRRFADAGSLRDGLDRHSREAALDQQRERSSCDRVIDTRVQRPHHRRKP